MRRRRAGTKTRMGKERDGTPRGTEEAERAARTEEGSTSVWLAAAQLYARRLASRSSDVQPPTLVTVAPTHEQPAA